MTTPEILGLILGSAGVGAFISTIVNGVFNWLLKRQELERRDMEMALKMAELKNQQLITTYEWYAKSGRDANVAFHDPLVSVIDYSEGMKEYRRTGRWAKGEASHGRRAP